MRRLEGLGTARHFPVLALTLFTMSAIGFSSIASETAPPSRKRVVVIDSGLNIHDPRFAGVLCPNGHRDFTGKGLRDTDGHGTHVAGIIMRNAPDHTKYCLVIYKTYTGETSGMPAYLDALAALPVDVPLVNISLTGKLPDEYEKGLLSHSKASFVVAAGNDGEYYKDTYPGGYGLPNVYVVGNWDCKAQKIGRSSNYGEGLIWRCGTEIVSTLPGGKEGPKTGTSMAAPLYTAEVINRGFK